MFVPFLTARRLTFCRRNTQLAQIDAQQIIWLKGELVPIALHRLQELRLEAVSGQVRLQRCLHWLPKPARHDDCHAREVSVNVHLAAVTAPRQAV